MSKLFSKNGSGAPAASQYETARQGVAALAATMGAQLKNKEVLDTIASMEGANHNFESESHRQAVSLGETVIQALRQTSLYHDIIAKAKPEQRDAALEAAGYTLLSAANARQWIETSGNAVETAGRGVTLVDPRQGYLRYNTQEEYSMEGFDPKVAENFLATDVTANAMAAMTGGFEDLFFPIIVVPANTGGLTATISIPQIMAPTYRDEAVTGTPFEIKRIPLPKAIANSKLLEDLSINVVPYATGAATPAALVPASEVPTWQAKIEGELVDTRPIRFGKNGTKNTVDLLNLSQHPGLLRNGVFDETDQLEPVVNLGTLFAKATLTDGSATHNVTFSSDVQYAVGALLQEALTGNTRRYLTVGTFPLRITNDSNLLTVSGGSVEDFRATVNAMIGQPAGSKFTVMFELDVSSSANSDFGNMDVDLTAARFVGIVNAQGQLAALESGAAVTGVDGLGYYPLARRTNSNIRTRGLVIDSQVQNRYAFPIYLGSPIISQNALNGPENTSVESLGHAQRIRNNNNAHKALFTAREQIGSQQGLPANTPAIGSELVNPTYIRRSMDVTELTRTISSREGLHDLRGQLVSALCTMANLLVTKSEYLSALEFMTGNNENFEVIVVTDPTIFNFMMETGDPRSMGAGRNFKFAQSLNSDMAGRIMMSVRRTERSAEIHPLDFGVFLYVPPRTHKVQISRNGRVVEEVHTVPCNAHYVTCPILGEITVAGLTNVFLDPLAAGVWNEA